VTRSARGVAPALLSVAIPKGRLLAEASELFERALGVSPIRLLENTRKLAADSPEHGLRFISIRAADVASYVEHGAADVGIGRCRVIVGRPRAARPLPRGVAPRVATKYVNLAARHFARKGIPAEIIALHGSIEVAPSLGLADLIVDITETGETLRANGLVVEETVLDVSARLVVNRVALKLHAEPLRRLVEALRSVTEG
jgi:ATP phosphoribosyltransferase